MGRIYPRALAIVGLLLLPRCGGELDATEYGDEESIADELAGAFPEGSVLATTRACSLRSGPSENRRVLASLPKGARVTLLQTAPTNGWYYVKHGTKTGWVRGAYLTLVAGPSFRNPVLEVSGDPFCAKFGNRYHLYLPDQVSRDGRLAGGKVLGFTSTDLVHWTAVGSVFDNIDFAYGDQKTIGLWAPEALSYGGKYYLYYVNNLSNPVDANLGDKDVAVVESSDPTNFHGGNRKVLLDKAYPVIDPSAFHDEVADKLYLVYKERPGASEIHIRPMSNPTTFSGPSVKLLESKDIPDSLGVLEHPHIYRKGGVFYLIFSKGLGDEPTYRIAYATADRATGPYKYQGVLFKSDGDLTGDLSKKVIAPGGSSIVHDRSGRTWMLYRQKMTKVTDWNDRVVTIDPVEFDPSNRSLTGRASKGESRAGPAPLPLQ